MKKNRFVVGLITSACLSVMPLLAQAHSLSIVNTTVTPLTFSVNGVCSKEIGTLESTSILNVGEK